MADSTPKTGTCPPRSASSRRRARKARSRARATSAIRRRSRPAARCWSRSRRRSRAGCSTLLAQALRFDAHRSLSRRRHGRAAGRAGGRGCCRSSAVRRVMMARGDRRRRRDRRLELDLQAADAEVRQAQSARRPAAPVLEAAADRCAEGVPAGAGARRDRRVLPAHAMSTRFAGVLAMPLPAAIGAAAQALLGGLVLLLLALARVRADRRAAAAPPALRAPEDEPPGAEAGAQGARGQRRGQGARSARACAR